MVLTSLVVDLGLDPVRKLSHNVDVSDSVLSSAATEQGKKSRGNTPFCSVL